MKRGTVVAVCHDGKWGRRVQGVVIATRQGHHIQVRFPHPETGAPVEFWARRRPAIRHVRRPAGSCCHTHKRYVRYGGWASTGGWSPWYSVAKWQAE